MSRKIGVALSYIVIVLEVLSTLLLTPFLIRTFGQAEYGVYKLSIAITTYLLLFDFGIGNALIRYISKFRLNDDKQSENKFLGISSIFYISVAVIVIVASVIIIVIFPYVFANGLSSDEIALAQKLILISSINAAFTMLTAPFANMLIAYEKFAVSKIASIIQISLKIGILFLVLNLGFTSIAVCLVNLGLTILCRSFFVIYSFVALKAHPTLKGISKPFIKEILLFSSLMFLQMVATQLNLFVDQILLGIIVTGASTIIAVYSVGTQIVQYYQSIGTAFTNVLMPGVVRMVENGGDSKTICSEMVKVGRFIFMVLGIVLVTFIIFGKQFIVLWAGEANEDAYYVAVILMSAYLLILMQSIGGQILWAKNMHKEQSILKICIVLINIGLTIGLIFWRPLIGAAIGTCISLVLGDIVVSNIIYKIKLKISLLDLFLGYARGILISLIVAFGAGFGFSFLKLPDWWGLAINVLVPLSTFIICMIIFGLNKQERLFFSKIFKSIFRRKTVEEKKESL